MIIPNILVRLWISENYILDSCLQHIIHLVLFRIMPSTYNIALLGQFSFITQIIEKDAM